ncbi:hypothetical protein N806_23675 [Rhodococcus sp. P27]|nr:hypothetical protein N806_23675 [Rhodococcus sp. P27]
MITVVGALGILNSHRTLFVVERRPESNVTQIIE